MHFVACRVALVQNPGLRRFSLEGAMIDRYTKFILTIIAISLATIALKDSPTAAWAQSRISGDVTLMNGPTPIQVMVVGKVSTQ